MHRMLVLCFADDVFGESSTTFTGGGSEGGEAVKDKRRQWEGRSTVLSFWGKFE